MAVTVLRGCNAVKGQPFGPVAGLRQAVQPNECPRGRSGEGRLNADAALPLPPSLLSAFTMQSATRLRGYPAEAVGVGLATLRRHNLTSHYCT
jgi:hypothetical protein